MLRVDTPTLVHHHDLIESAEVRTEAMPVPDRYGTYWMPATEKLPPTRDFASAAGAMTLVQDRQALAEALREDHVPSYDHARRFTPWGEVIRDMARDVKSLVYLPLIVIVGLLVMLWIFKVNGPDAIDYKIVPRSPVSTGHPVTTQTPAQPSQRHRKPVAPEPVPSEAKTRLVPVEPAPTHSASAVPVPKPKPTHTTTPKPEPKPTHTTTPTPDPQPTLTQTPDPQPQPTVEPTRDVPEPPQPQETTRETAPAQEPVISGTPRS